MCRKLCIIIPMFNAEAFIERTINSIVQSNLPADYYNILIVNDGSTDGSSDVVEKLTRRIPNLRYVNQNNGGASLARNTGIDNSESEYIWFIDADDKVESDVSIIPSLIAENPEVEIFCFEYNWVNTANIIYGHGCSHPSVIHNQVIKGREAILQGYKPGSVCGLILKRSLLDDNHFRFKVGITQEDVELSLQLFAHALKVMFRYEVIYNYMIRQNTANTPTNTDKKIKYELDKVEVVLSFLKLAQSFKGKDEELALKIQQYGEGALFGCVYNLYKNRNIYRPLGINHEVLKKLKEKELYPMKYPVGSWKKIFATLFLNRDFFLL